MYLAEDDIVEKPFLITHIISIHKTHDIFLNKFIKESGIKPSQYYMLLYLNENKDFNQSEIAACCLMDRCGVSRAFKEFEEKGIITREISKESKREYDVSLTEKGQKIVDFLLSKEFEWEEEICDNFDIDSDELHRIMAQFSRLSVDFNKKRYSKK